MINITYVVGLMGDREEMHSSGVNTLEGKIANKVFRKGCLRK